MKIEQKEASRTASPIELEELGKIKAKSDGPWVKKQNDWIKNVKVDLTVVVGKATTTVEQLFALKNGDALELDTAVDAPVELRLDGRLIGRGQLMAVGNQFGIRITEIEDSKP